VDASDEAGELVEAPEAAGEREAPALAAKLKRGPALAATHDCRCCKNIMLHSPVDASDEAGELVEAPEAAGEPALLTKKPRASAPAVPRRARISGLYHSTLGLRVIKKKKKLCQKGALDEEAEGQRA